MAESSLQLDEASGASDEIIESSSVELDATQPIPRMRLGQISYNGTLALGGEILESCKQELQFPQSIRTFDQMAEDQDIQPALDVPNASICRVKWKVTIPEGYEDELEEEAAFLEQALFQDMEHPFEEFIAQAVSLRQYGFAPFEKVYRNRTYRSGSKFNDNKVGVRSLSLIDQHTVRGWKWDEETGRKLTHICQYITKPQGVDPTQPWKMAEMGEDGKNYVSIPMKKVMNLRNKRKGNSPQGSSFLVGAWRAWRLKTSLEEFLAVGVVKDLQGLPIIEVPADVMAVDAPDEKKQEYLFWQNVIRNVHQNAQAGLVLPSDRDERGNPLYNLRTVEAGGQKAYDVLSIIEFYRKSILTALFAQQLVLGQDGSGSYSLSESMAGVTGLSVETTLREIEQALNHDLVPQLFALNGVQKQVLPRITYGDVLPVDLETLSKFIQRVSAVGLMSRDAKTVNWIAKQANMPIPFDGEELIQDIEHRLTGYTSGAGEGMEKGGSNGTSDNASETDNSTSNLEN